MNEIKELKVSLSAATLLRDEYLRERNTARQLACDLAKELKAARHIYEGRLPYPEELIKRVERGLGLHGYEWSQPGSQEGLDR